VLLQDKIERSEDAAESELATTQEVVMRNTGAGGLLGEEQGP
jgi:hypothetical protein